MHLGQGKKEIAIIRPKDLSQEDIIPNKKQLVSVRGVS